MFVKKGGKSVHILEEKCLKELIMWLQEFVPPPTCFLTKWIAWKCRIDKSSFHSLILTKHLHQMVYRQGQKYHHQKNIQRAHLRSCFTSANMSSPTGLMRGHFGFSKSKKPASSNVTISIWVRFSPSCIGHKEGKVSLSSAYFLLVLPTQHIRSSWSKWLGPNQLVQNGNLVKLDMGTKNHIEGFFDQNFQPKKWWLLIMSIHFNMSIFSSKQFVYLYLSSKKLIDVQFSSFFILFFILFSSILWLSSMYMWKNIFHIIPTWHRDILKIFCPHHQNILDVFIHHRFMFIGSRLCAHFISLLCIYIYNGLMWAQWRSCC